MEPISVTNKQEKKLNNGKQIYGQKTGILVNNPFIPFQFDSDVCPKIKNKFCYAIRKTSYKIALIIWSWKKYISNFIDFSDIRKI